MTNLSGYEAKKFWLQPLKSACKEKNNLAGGLKFEILNAN